MSLELYRHDLNVLERHCEAVGRDLAEIERVEDEIAKAFDRSGRRYPVGKRAGNSACLPSANCARFRAHLISAASA